MVNALGAFFMREMCVYCETWQPPGQQRSPKMNKEQLQALLDSTQKKLADQGRIVDARLLEKERQILERLKELENGKT